MEQSIPPSRRRRFLRGTLAFLGGAVGLKVAGQEPAPAPPPSPPAPNPGGASLRLYARCRPDIPGTLPGSAPVTERRTQRGALVPQLDAGPVGEYFTTNLAPPGPFGTPVQQASGVDLQTFRLAEGTLFGAGSNEKDGEGATLHAVLGGTGRFAGVRGTYRMKPIAGPSRTENWVQIDITLLDQPQLA